MIKKILTYFFVGLGVIFFLLLIVGAYFFLTDPLGFFRSGGGTPFSELVPVTEESSSNDNTATTTGTDPNPGLSPAQEQALQSIGIDPESVPASFTPEQEACFVGILGAPRVAEIKAGDSPTPMEFFRAKACVE